MSTTPRKQANMLEHIMRTSMRNALSGVGVGSPQDLLMHQLRNRFLVEEIECNTVFNEQPEILNAAFRALGAAIQGAVESDRYLAMLVEGSEGQSWREYLLGMEVESQAIVDRVGEQARFEDLDQLQSILQRYRAFVSQVYVVERAHARVVEEAPVALAKQMTQDEASFNQFADACLAMAGEYAGEATDDETLAEAREWIHSQCLEIISGDYTSEPLFER